MGQMTPRSQAQARPANVCDDSIVDRGVITAS
jgi:hypothetical protein